MMIWGKRVVEERSRPEVEDLRIVLRAAWHGAFHAFDDEERERIIRAIEKVERGC